jgi:hypothetical protein
MTAKVQVEGVGTQLLRISSIHGLRHFLMATEGVQPQLSCSTQEREGVAGERELVINAEWHVGGPGLKVRPVSPHGSLTACLLACVPAWG